MHCCLSAQPNSFQSHVRALAFSMAAFCSGVMLAPPPPAQLAQQSDATPESSQLLSVVGSLQPVTVKPFALP